jgi:hypothetical protein
MDYRVVTVERRGEWRAHAERLDTGDRFGVECTGETEAEAIARLHAWLAWQEEHVAALADLQQAERGYHRSVADSAFSPGASGPSSERRAALGALDAARVTLDAVRARRPETP